MEYSLLLLATRNNELVKLVMFAKYCFHYCFINLVIQCRLFGAVVVIAANAGGAWTPIGDVTTTMLWIHGQISTVRTMQVSMIDTTR